MLASTVQFSNNKPKTTPTAPPNAEHQNPETQPADANRNSPEKETRSWETRPSSQDPTAYPTIHQHPPQLPNLQPNQGRTHPKNRSRRTRHETNTVEPELVSVPPMSTHRRTDVCAWA